jgi:hypothetical protein
MLPGGLDQLPIYHDRSIAYEDHALTTTSTTTSSDNRLLWRMAGNEQRQISHGVLRPGQIWHASDRSPGPTATNRIEGRGWNGALTD